MSAPAAILEFRDATLVSSRLHHVEMEGLAFRLAAGEVLLVRVEEGHESLPLADAACGLLPPASGEIWFAGQPWSERGPWEQARARGRIHRVFDRPAWISNLDVLENVTLAQLHHTWRHTADVETEAERWAIRFGLPHLPEGRPAAVRPADLRKCEWVRAFLGHPELILLERPEQGVPPADAGCLWPAVEAASGGGSAIVWLTAQPRVWEHQPHVGVRRAAMHGARFTLFEEAASTP